MQINGNILIIGLCCDLIVCLVWWSKIFHKIIAKYLKDRIVETLKIRNKYFYPSIDKL